MSRSDHPPEVIFGRLIQDLEIGSIDIGEENVRKTEVQADLDGLEESIDLVGVIQPVIVIAAGKGRFKLISGQRRYYACKRLGRKTIPALEIASVSPQTQTLISFGENVHRRELPYIDTVKVVSTLYDQLTGSDRSRVRKVSQLTGLSEGSVVDYLGHRLVPPEVQRLVQDKQLTKDQAKALTEVFFDQPQKIIAIAKETPRLTKPEKNRVVEVSRRRPDSSPKEIVDEAQRPPPPQMKLTVWIDKGTHDKLSKIARERGYGDISSLVKSLIDELVAGRLRP